MRLSMTAVSKLNLLTWVSEQLWRENQKRSSYKLSGHFHYEWVQSITILFKWLWNRRIRFIVGFFVRSPVVLKWRVLSISERLYNCRVRRIAAFCKFFCRFGSTDIPNIVFKNLVKTRIRWATKTRRLLFSLFVIRGWMVWSIFKGLHYNWVRWTNRLWSAQLHLVVISRAPRPWINLLRLCNERIRERL